MRITYKIQSVCQKLDSAIDMAKVAGKKITLIELTTSEYLKLRMEFSNYDPEVAADILRYKGIDVEVIDE